MKIYVIGIKNSIAFKIKTGCNLEPVTPESIKVLGSNKSNLEKEYL